MGVENNELKDFNSQLKHCINDMTASMSALKETLVSCNCRGECAENQTQYLVAESQYKLFSTRQKSCLIFPI